mmetsp:Transcript_20346/g.49965  ORF Transcript_20346/g.49965 Transcript_20346/m.49965 type:complete len:180 (-) Transcript_20346:157-696(-)|eukprot:CAMPEP_0114495314 /NCGR_PEP_ID=MMETSP0109-20121206/5142_1 /TAXON_ID=29199 /ORGANISM="Chlorarachnion reptans, Strain CCCM449" /LENGTH=179 /DNA_ID=CAMNT_0001672455 /DNA_START=74 /DNA_END=613 /DNA_ORIENTATION=+
MSAEFDVLLPVGITFAVIIGVCTLTAIAIRYRSNIARLLSWKKYDRNSLVKQLHKLVLEIDGESMSSQAQSEFDLEESHAPMKEDEKSMNIAIRAPGVLSNSTGAVQVQIVSRPENCVTGTRDSDQDNHESIMAMNNRLELPRLTTDIDNGSATSGTNNTDGSGSPVIVEIPKIDVKTL